MSVPTHAVNNEAVTRRFHELHAELESRAFAVSWGLQPADREDFMQEAACWAWQWLLAADRKGKLDRPTAFSLVTYPWRTWRSGRRFAVTGNVSDAMSEQARAGGRMCGHSLDDIETKAVDHSIKGRAISIALVDSRHPQPDEVARTEMDFGLVRRDPSLTDRAAQVFERLLLDHEQGHGKRIADELGVSQPRIVQLKRQELAPALERIGYTPTRPAA